MRTLLGSAAALLMLSAVSAQLPPDLPPQPAPGFPPANQRPITNQFKELVPSLIEAMKDADGEVRQYAAMALAALGTEAIDAVVEALKDASKERRAAAAYALGQMGFQARDAIPSLLKTMKDTEADVRRSAALAMSRILAEGNIYAPMNFSVPGRAVGNAETTPRLIPVVPAPAPTPAKPEIPK